MKILIVIVLAFLVVGCDFADLLDIDPEMDKIVAKKDAAACQKLDDESGGRIDRCLSKVAVALGDNTACGKIDETGRRSNCYNDVAVAIGDEESCSLVEITSRSYCYSKIAENEADEAICSMIRADDRGSDDCYSRVAVVKRDEDLCVWVKGEVPKFDCLSSVAAKGKFRDPCDKIENNDDRKELCLKGVAVASGDKKLCTEIPLGQTQYSCLQEVAVASKSSSPCADLPDPMRADLCRMEVASTAGKIAICDEVGLESRKNTCYVTVGTNTEDLAACEKVVKDAKLTDSCFDSIARGKRDKSICSKIADFDKKNTCYTDIEGNE